MALELLNADTVQVLEGDNLNWQGAIRRAAKPLVENGTVGEDYVQSMIDVVQDKGPYINIGPNIALAHSRPSDSVKKVGLALLKTNCSIDLVSEEHPIKLWFVLSAVDSNSHLKVIQELSQVLMDKERTNGLLASTSVDQILDVLKD
ncbi:PTS sugar transporter subunit IIA [Limosilactobacillus caecicola]|uniref:PTS sugar transporter subunit IIA n=1 Tax=Limosilactobacillus caecicola TaxID=2941332 RepID=UPI00203D89B0|nr:PTS sugar transporter subunit IIA [Limosilactobacillus caecicola]